MKKEMRVSVSDLVEQCHDIRKVDPAVPVEIKRSDRFVYRNPGHLVKVQDNIGEVQPSVAVKIFVDAVPVRIGRQVNVPRQREQPAETRSGRTPKSRPATGSAYPEERPVICPTLPPIVYEGEANTPPTPIPFSSGRSVLIPLRLQCQ